MRKIKLLSLLLIGFMLSTTVDAQKRKQFKAIWNSSYAIEVQTLGVGNDGTKLIKVWAMDKKVDAAVYKAKKNAVLATIFRGLPAGGGQSRTPAICKDGDYDKNVDFFENFFADGGAYLNYINMSSDGMPSGRDRLKMKKGYKCAIVVSINFDGLRKYLEDQGIARRLDSGF